MYKINCLNPISKIGLDSLTSDYVLTDKAEEAEGILVRSAAMHDMELPDKLLAVARAGAGTNNIPLDKCVKDLVLAGMLLASRDIVGGIEWVKGSAYDENIAKAAEKEKKKFAGTEIEGKKLGVIGLGAIGAKVANAAVSLGMEVYGYDPYLSVTAAWSLSSAVKHVINVEDIYTQCDFITIHVPLLVSQMKDGVVILNFARDLLADEKAVLEGIKSGKVSRYVSDFPNPVTAGQPGCIVIPHLGASTEEAEDNCAKMAVQELMDYLENGNIKNSVNYPACDMGVCTKAGRVAIFHKNIANMITKFTAEFGDKGINIIDMTN